VRPPARYKARVPKDSLSYFLMSNWDVDGDEKPSGDMIPICWSRPWQPLAWPVGWRVVRAGRVWQ
jgi:hypothetical protein